MEIKQFLHKFADDLAINSSHYKLWQSFCTSYQKHGIAYLEELMGLTKQYHALLQTLQIINQEKNIKKILNTIMDTAIEITGAERGFLLVKKMEVARNFTGEDIAGEYKISKKVAEYVLTLGKPLLTDNAQEDQRLSPYTSVQEYKFRSILCSPLSVKGENIGVLYLDNRLLEAGFNASDLQILAAFSSQAAIAIENAYLYRDMTGRAKKAENINVELSSKVKVQTEELDLMRQTLHEIKGQYSYHQLYARSPQMQEIFSQIEKIKNSELSVLIEGESGTGKELVARAIHFSSQRWQKRFVSENCAAIPDTVFESELFGYEKGAFTGANQLKKGLFEEAHKGTIFLDEIGEISLGLQKKLLRVLEEKKVRRVGGRALVPIDVRVIAATNRNLEEMIKMREFREDLFYRLKIVKIWLPPLRERKEDIPLLINYFLKEIAKHGSVKKINSEVASVLLEYDWPGNIRQLRNEINSLATLSGKTLEKQYISPEILKGPQHRKATTLNVVSTTENVANLPLLLKNIERNEILKAISVCGKNRSKAAQLLGISRYSLQRKMDKLGLK